MSNPNEFEAGGVRYDGFGRRIIGFRALNSTPRTTDKPEGGTVVDEENRELVVGFELGNGEFEKLAVLGSTGVILKAEQTGKAGGLALSIRSLSESEHAATLNMAAKKGPGSALNAVSSNVEKSAVQISGVENGTGTLKISHTNSSTTETGDANAAMLSLETHNGEEGGTAVQGIAMKAAEAKNSGAWLTVRNSVAGLIARMKSTGVFEFKETSSPGNLEAECWATWFEVADPTNLKFKLGSGAAKKIKLE